MYSTEFFEKLNEQFRNQKAFVAYRKSGSRKVKSLLQKDKQINRIEDFSESGFVFAPFDSETDSYLISTENSEVFDCEFIPESTTENTIVRNQTDFVFMEKDQMRHEILVQKGIDEICEGAMKKVVLARSEKVQIHDPDPIRIFGNLLKKYKEAFVYVWYHPETGCWLGATPETLLNMTRNRFNTMALAGTQVYNGKTDVEWNKKEVEEQKFVTDYILDSLENLEAVKNVGYTKPYTSKAGNLLHICTDISGSLIDRQNIGDLVKTLHPTPAVCGLPKENALQFIKDNEDTSRDFYSGYLGELNMKSESKRNSNRKNQENQQFMAISKKTDLYVNLRCMQLRNGEAKIYVGGGITKDSNAADEWMETVNKSQTMKSVLVK